nr:ferrochelatase [uncultured Carboxylicivirga sp.]
MSKTGILIVNLGTPDSYNKKDVKKYLSEFLMDGRVIDISYWKRFLLVNGIIAPFRSKKVSKEYKKLWLTNGSPLKVYGEELVDKVQSIVNEENKDAIVVLGMRYKNPSIETALDILKREAVDRIIVFPLFPQYASATVGSVAQKVMDITKNWEVIPSINFINDYHDNENYINSFTQKVIDDVNNHKPDHILFSYHGIPERHLQRVQKQNDNLCSYPECSCHKLNVVHRYCYRSACYNTTKLIANKAGLSSEVYSTSFQSRLGKTPWIQPYTDNSIVQLAKNGVRNLLVVSPSFVADCLETTLEIGEQYKELFIENGGAQFAFTKSLNADDNWAKAVVRIIERKIKL